MAKISNTGRVDTLLGKAAEAQKSDDALKFSQAALNAANALRVLNDYIEHV